jgi:hypothetical protein
MVMPAMGLLSKSPAERSEMSPPLAKIHLDKSLPGVRR